MSAVGDVARDAAAKLRAIADVLDYDVDALTSWSFSIVDGRVTIKLAAKYTREIADACTSTHEIADALGLKL